MQIQAMDLDSDIRALLLKGSSEQNLKHQCPQQQLQLVAECFWMFDNILFWVAWIHLYANAQQTWPK